MTNGYVISLDGAPTERPELWRVKCTNSSPSRPIYNNFAIKIIMSKLGFYSTALEAVKGFDLTGKTALITGGNSGIVRDSVTTATGLLKALYRSLVLVSYRVLKL